MAAVRACGGAHAHVRPGIPWTAAYSFRAGANTQFAFSADDQTRGVAFVVRARQGRPCGRGRRLQRGDRWAGPARLSARPHQPGTAHCSIGRRASIVVVTEEDRCYWFLMSAIPIPFSAFTRRERPNPG